METFGLLNFLQNALFSVPAATSQKEEEQSAAPPTRAATDTETLPVAEAQKETVPVKTDKENAFLQFMAAHDARAKRAKKQ